MFKKIKPVWLIIILIILLGIYFIVRYTGQEDRNFRSMVVEFDPKSVTEVWMTIPGKEEKTHLIKEGKEWRVTVRDEDHRADTNHVVALLGQLSRLETKRFAGRGKDAWKKYELTDSAAVRVQLYENKKEIADLMVGKFEYTPPPEGQPQGMMQQPQGEMSTFVRLQDEKEVYVVDGILKMAVSREGEAYRDKALVGVLRNDITRVSFQYPEQSMTLEKQDQKWMLDGAPADSLEAVRYATMVARIAGQEFIYEDIQLGSPTHTVTIEGNNFSPVEIKAYPVADTNYNYVLISSKNPEALFSGKKSDLFNRLMVGPGELLPGPGKED